MHSEESFREVIMPLLTRTFIKTAMVYFSLALLVAVLMTLRAPTDMFPVYIHLLVFGWLLFLSAILQWFSAVAFVVNSWPRVREK